MIHTVALAEGITATDLAKITCNKKIVDVEYDQIPDRPISDCPRERWMKVR